LLLLYLAAFPALFRPVLHGSDPLGYYAWVRSAVIDGDLNVDNEFHDLHFDEYHQIITPTGHRANQWSAGPALLWSPFYLVAHGLTTLQARLGGPWPADGYSLPYTVATGLASTMYALMGLFLLYSLARRYAADSVAALAVTTIWFASPLVFYMYSSPMMSHAVDVFACSLFVWVWQRTRPWPTGWGWIARGACIGLSTLIRPQNILLGILPVLDLGQKLFDHDSPRRQRIGVVLRSALSFGVGILVFMGPQMVFWRIVYGYWIVNTYTFGQDGTLFTPLQPHVLEALFSTDRGLFFWSPVLLPALGGLVALFRQDRRLALLLALNFCVQCYVISSNIWWNGAPSFGARYFLGNTPAFVLGLAALGETLRKRIGFRPLAAVSVAFIVWNLLLLVQYVLETVPRIGPVNVGLMVRNQFTVIPENAPRIIRALISRMSE